MTGHFVALGMVADFAIHDVRARDGGRQPHSHVMLTLRRIDPESRTGFGLKETAWNRKELLCEWREAWAGHVNAALEQAAVAERVDHRTLEAQRREAAAAGNFEKAAELDREPEPKVGPQAWALERDGIATDRGDMLREVQERNAGARGLRAVAEHGEAARPASSPCASRRATRSRRSSRGARKGGGAVGLRPRRDGGGGDRRRGARPAAGAGFVPAAGSDRRGDGAGDAAGRTRGESRGRGHHGDLGGDGSRERGRRYSPADLADLARFEAMAQAERARVEAMGGEWTYPGYILANPDPEDRMHEARATEELFARADAAEEAAFYAEEPEAWEVGVTAGDWPAPLGEEEIAAIEREEAEPEAEADGQEVDEAEALLAEMEEQDRAAEQEGLEIGD